MKVLPFLVFAKSCVSSCVSLFLFVLYIFLWVDTCASSSHVSLSFYLLWWVDTCASSSHVSLSFSLLFLCSSGMIELKKLKQITSGCLYLFWCCQVTLSCVVKYHTSSGIWQHVVFKCHVSSHVFLFFSSFVHVFLFFSSFVHVFLFFCCQVPDLLFSCSCVSLYL